MDATLKDILEQYTERPLTESEIDIAEEAYLLGQRDATADFEAMIEGA